MNKKGLLITLVCLCGALIAVISFYAVKHAQMGDGDAMSSSVYMDLDSSDGDGNRVLNEVPVEPGSDIGTNGGGADTVGGSVYIDLNEDGGHSLSESPLDE